MPQKVLLNVVRKPRKHDDKKKGCHGSHNTNRKMLARDNLKLAVVY